MSEDIVTLNNKYNKKIIIGMLCLEIPILKCIKIKYKTQKAPNIYDTIPFLSNM
tara:strand:- start:407 stop:568 length:162 start_codon:yes stop_codon:yes gene_type:complete